MNQLSMSRLSAEQIADALELPRPTPAQRAVIEAPLEPMLVVAGAGAGKTETMAGRVVWLVANRLVEPDQVLGLTFTRKGAGELAQRIEQRLSALSRSNLIRPLHEDVSAQKDGGSTLDMAPSVSTYNSFAGRIVDEHGLRLGIEPDSRLLATAAAWQMCHDLVMSWDQDMQKVNLAPSSVTEAVIGLAGEISEHLRSPQEVQRFGDGLVRHLAELKERKGRARLNGADDVLKQAERQNQIVPLVAAFIERKKERSALDFADQVRFAAALAQRFPAIGAALREQYRVVLLDEFQDTSEAQISFLASLFGQGDNRPAVVAVGDPHQSIFGWRGASATTLSKFRVDFALPEQDLTPVRALATSWRNDEAILRAANIVAEPLRAKSAVPVETLEVRPGAGPGRVEALRAETELDEAAAIAEWIEGRRAEGAKTCAVLCRARSQFTAILEALIARNIPAEAVGLGGLLQTPEIVDLVSLLRVVDEPGRTAELMRLLTGASMRLGAADIDGLYAWSRELTRRLRQELEIARSSAAETGSADPVVPDAAAPDNAVPDSATPGAPPVSLPLPSLAEVEVTLVEALEKLPPPSWQGPEGEQLSERARERLRGFAVALERLRALGALPLPDLIVETERVLGLDIEGMAYPDSNLALVRAHVDAFVDAAANFAVQAERPTLGAFLDWLDAAIAQERGLDAPDIDVSTDAVQVLTIHAAKGLEWDAVAVAGLRQGRFPSLDGRSKRHDGEWQYSENRIKGWLKNAGSLPYPLRRDAAGLPPFDVMSATEASEFSSRFDEYIDAGLRHQLLEERRLAYVALTRAKQSMLLSTHVWGLTGKPPRVTSQFLTELIEAKAVNVISWAPMPDVEIPDEELVNPVESQVVQAEWPVDAMAHRRAALEPVAEKVQAHITARDYLPEDADLEVDLLLAERHRAGRVRATQPTLPDHLSASAVVALSEDPQAYLRSVRRPMPTPPALAARRGTAFHAWVEQHFSEPVLLDVDALPGFDDETTADVSLAELKENFLASPWASMSPIELEVPIETVVAGRAIRGRIDAVFPRAGGGFTIVDWKSGRQPSAKILDHKRWQLAAYALAYARLKGVDPERIDAAFFYAASGETYRPELPGLTELEQLLSRVEIGGAVDGVDDIELG